MDDEGRMPTTMNRLNYNSNIIRFKKIEFIAASERSGSIPIRAFHHTFHILVLQFAALHLDPPSLVESLQQHRTGDRSLSGRTVVPSEQPDQSLQPRGGDRRRAERRDERETAEVEGIKSMVKPVSWSKVGRASSGPAPGQRRGDAAAGSRKQEWSLNGISGSVTTLLGG